MKQVPKLKKKKHDWAEEGDESLLLSLFWDKVADPGDMDTLFLSASQEVDLYLQWITVPMPGSEGVEREDLRPLDLNFGAGVKALWSDEAGTIAAFAFSPGMFTEESAQEWLSESKNLTASEFEPTDAALALTSFGEIECAVRKELLRMYKVEPDPGGAVPCWILSIGLDKVIFQHNKSLMGADYIIVDGEALIDNVREVKEEHFYTDKDTDERLALSQGENVIYAFSSALGDGAEAEAGDDDGLIWKEVIHPGAWYKSSSGKRIQVTGDIVNEAIRAFNAGMPKYVSVPANHHHLQTGGVVPAEDNRGFVRKFKCVGEKVFSAFDITNKATREAVENGSIADCSVYIQPGAFHNSTGEEFKWIFRHVLLTNDPLVNDLAEFGAIPASGSDAGNIYLFHQEDTMSDEITMSAEHGAVIDKLEAYGLSADDVIALADQKAAIAAQAADLRNQKRGLEIACIVNAMQGKGEHPLVTPMEGTSHYPVVASAVEAALSKLPEALALDAGDDGSTPVDAVIMGIVNAIPGDGRLALNAQPKHPQPQSEPKTVRDLSDEEVDAAMDAMGV